MKEEEREKEEEKEGERKERGREEGAIRNVMKFGEAEGERVFKAEDRIINVSVFSILINAINELFSIWLGAQFRRTAGNRHLVPVYIVVY